MEQLKRDLGLSPITLGTMRFFDKNLSSKQVLDIIEKGYDIGITTHHSSYEYNSFKLYSDALKVSSCKKNIKHIVKLAAPHFDEKSFSPKEFKKKITNQLIKLDIDNIDVLQWLVRSKPINDIDRLDIILNQADEIEEYFTDLKKSGVVKSIFSFPYSIPFADKVVKLECIDGIIAYLNLSETDFENFANSVPFICIRPLFSGNLISSQKDIAQEINACLEYVDSNKTVLSKIISINSLEQLNTYK